MARTKPRQALASVPDLATMNAGTALSSKQVVMSHGMGVDTVAMQLRFELEPDSHDFDLQRDLTVVTAMTGNEHPQTGEYMERYMLPRMRQCGIRYVQLARAGQEKRHGYVVLSDSREPIRMHMRGPWRLEDEMRSVGTVPSVQKGRRWCSVRAKGDPIDWWVADHCEPGYTHISGYAAEESWRAQRDTDARREKEAKGEALLSRPSYPLIEWGWDRRMCELYILDVLGVHWPRSCCTFCPFQETAGTRKELVTRWRDQPEAGADALVLEYTSLALNERIGLFGVRSTADDLVRRESLDEVRAVAEGRLGSAPAWSLVEVRRVFDAKKGDNNAKGRAWRSTRVTATGSREEMLERLRFVTDTTLITDVRGHTRAWRERLPTEGITYPATEWLWVVVPAGVKDKQMPGFETVWTRAHTAPLF